MWMYRTFPSLIDLQESCEDAQVEREAEGLKSLRLRVKPGSCNFWASAWINWFLCKKKDIQPREDYSDVWECSANPRPGWVPLPHPDCSMGTPRCVVTFHSLPLFGFHGKKMWVCGLEVLARPSWFLACLYGGLWGELCIIRALQLHGLSWHLIWAFTEIPKSKTTFSGLTSPHFSLS